MDEKNPSARYVLAVDLGSGGPKVGLVNQRGEVVASAVERTTTHLLPNGGAEQDPHEWWRAVCAGVRRVIQAAAAPPESILAVSCTSQWAVIVPVDETGEALMNAIHWLDTRGGPYNRQITRGFPSIQGYGLLKLYRWISKVGLPPTHSGVDDLGHILFIKHERPEIYHRTHKFLEPMDYLNLRFTGKIAASQLTALPMLMTDNRTTNCLDYDPWLVQVAGVDKAKLPDLLPNDAILGTVLPAVAAELGLSPNTIVIMSANDNHTAAIGSGAVSDYDGVAVLGTSGFLACHLPAKKSDLTHLLTTIPSPVPGRYLLLAELGNTGKVLESYLHNLVYAHDHLQEGAAPGDLYERMNRVVEQTPAGSDGVLFLPWFNGSLAPQEDRSVRGGFLNLSHNTTRAHMTRAVLEGIAFNWRWLLGPAEKLMGRPFELLRLSGGGAQSDIWAQIMADVLNLPIHQLAAPRDANVRGAAFLALHRLGLLTWEGMPKLAPMARIYEPQPANRAVYDGLFQQFLAAYKNVKPIYHALNR